MHSLIFVECCVVTDTSPLLPFLYPSPFLLFPCPSLSPLPSPTPLPPSSFPPSPSMPFLFTDITGDFSDALRTHLPLTTLFTDDQLHSAVSGLIQNFVDNIIITQELAYNTSAFVQNTTNRLVDLAAESFAPESMTQQMCITSFIRQRINQMALSLVDRDLEQIRRGVTTAVRILMFLHNYNLTLGNFQPLQRCQQRLVELSFCSRCTRHIPPLCSNTCGALIRACYSPFIDGLRGEFDNLWSVTRQVFRVTNNTLMQLFSEENLLVMFNPINVRPVMITFMHEFLLPYYSEKFHMTCVQKF